MLMQALFFCAGCLRYAFLMSAIGLAVWLYWEDLEAIYSNSNILFLRKDAEILFFRVPEIYILWSEELPCINYGSVIFCLSLSAIVDGGKTFSRSKAFSKILFPSRTRGFRFYAWRRHRWLFEMEIVLEAASSEIQHHIPLIHSIW